MFESSLLLLPALLLPGTHTKRTRYYSHQSDFVDPDRIDAATTCDAASAIDADADADWNRWNCTLNGAGLRQGPVPSSYREVLSAAGLWNKSAPTVAPTPPWAGYSSSPILPWAPPPDDTGVMPRLLRALPSELQPNQQHVQSPLLVQKSLRAQRHDGGQVQGRKLSKHVAGTTTTTTTTTEDQKTGETGGNAKANDETAAAASSSGNTPAPAPATAANTAGSAPPAGEGGSGSGAAAEDAKMAALAAEQAAYCAFWSARDHDAMMEQLNERVLTRLDSRVSYQVIQ